MLVPAKLDQEWVVLIKEAKAAGLTIEEVKTFIKQQHIES
ncbi:anti-repressor SinI family protein [Salibacterium aidingense]|nr:anti-repressor SinI family protein [Salibacterium aidingense]